MNTLTGMLKAFCGKKVYHRLFGKRKISEDVSVFLLIDESCEKYFVNYLPAYRKKYCTRMIIYVKAEDEDETKLGKNETDVDVVRVKRKELMSLMYYVVLFGRDRNFQFLSFEEPFGRNGRALIGVRGITEENIFSIGIMGLGDVPALSDRNCGENC